MRGNFDHVIHTLYSASLTYGGLELAWLKNFGQSGTLASDIASMAVVDLRNAILRQGAGVPGYKPYTVSLAWAKIKREHGWGSFGYYATGSLLSSLQVLGGKGSQRAEAGVDPQMSVKVIPGGHGQVQVLQYATALDKHHMLLALAIQDFVARKGLSFGKAAVDAFTKVGAVTIAELCASNSAQKVSSEETGQIIRTALRLQGVKQGYPMEEINKVFGH